MGSISTFALLNVKNYEKQKGEVNSKVKYL